MKGSLAPQAEKRRGNRRRGRWVGRRGVAPAGRSPRPVADVLGKGQYGFVTPGAADRVRKTYRSEFAVRAAFVQQYAAGRSKHVPPVHGVGLDKQGRFYLTMPHCGLSLDRIVRREGPLSGGRFASLARQIVAGVTDLWREGLVHGDLKLDNIMVGADGRAWLIDFDITVAIQERTYGEGGLMYASALRPPEMLAQRAEMRATPVGKHWLILAEHWAVGIVLWTMASGFAADFYAGYRNGCTVGQRLRQLLALFGRDDDVPLYTVAPEPGCAPARVPACMQPYMSLLRIHWAQRALPEGAPSFRFALDDTPWQALRIAPPSDPAAHRGLVAVLDHVADEHGLPWRVRVMARVLVDAAHEVLRWTPPWRLVIAAVSLSQSLCRAREISLKGYPDLSPSAVRRTAVAIANAVDQALPIGSLAFFQDEPHLESLYRIIEHTPDRIQYYHTP